MHFDWSINGGLGSGPHFMHSSQLQHSHDSHKDYDVRAHLQNILIAEIGDYVWFSALYTSRLFGRHFDCRLSLCFKILFVVSATRMLTFNLNFKFRCIVSLVIQTLKKKRFWVRNLNLVCGSCAVRLCCSNTGLSLLHCWHCSFKLLHISFRSPQWCYCFGLSVELDALSAIEVTVTEERATWAGEWEHG